MFVDDEADELVSVAGDTDDDEGDGSMQHTGEGEGADAGAGAGAGGSSRSLRRGRSKKFIKGTSLPYIQVDVRYPRRSFAVLQWLPFVHHVLCAAACGATWVGSERKKTLVRWTTRVPCRARRL